MFSRNSTRKPLNLIKSLNFTNTPCKSTCLYNAPSMHTAEVREKRDMKDTLRSTHLQSLHTDRHGMRMRVSGHMVRKRTDKIVTTLSSASLPRALSTLQGLGPWTGANMLGSKKVAMQATKQHCPAWAGPPKDPSKDTQVRRPSAPTRISLANSSVWGGGSDCSLLVPQEKRAHSTDFH